MKKTIFLLILLLTVCFSSQLIAGPKFPDKGWHKGPYLLITGGMMQATNDKNVDINKKFGSTFAPSAGLIFGWDITDWIGPQLVMQYGFATDTVGDGSAGHPTEHGREHLINIALMGRVTFLTQWKNLSDNVKMLPYLKLGAAAHGLYVHASSDANKAGSWGYGPAVGGGLEFLFWDRMWLGFDIQENLLFLQGVKKTVNGVQNTEIIEGGFYPQFNLLGTLGYHF